MDTRIATLLGSESFLDRTAIDQLSLLPPPSVAPRRPLPVEPSPVGDDARTNKTPRAHEHASAELYFSSMRPQSSQPHRHRSQKSAVPLAEVLNNEENGSGNGHNFAGTGTNSAPVFSGSLSDILTDSQPRKRRKLESPSSVHNTNTSSAAPGNTHNALNGSAEVDPATLALTLPKPQPLQQKKGNRRPRIPPLLQGLHQPPPDAGLFPPITGEQGRFRDTLEERDREKERAVTHADAEVSGAIIAASQGLQDRDQAWEESNGGNSGKQNRVPEASTSGKKKERAKGQKRNKWTEQETRDLLRGVSKHGIGNWKKILECQEFVFRGRSSVDLKDRFRTCCPEEYRKFRANNNTISTKPTKPNENAAGAIVVSEASKATKPAVETITKTTSRKPRSGTDRKGTAELAEMGIDKPFFKSNRRERREFTDRDDDALLRGFERHGPIWHTIRSDPELGFQTRHPTDLRDRFRIKYPEKFAKAGYKLKLKEARHQMDNGEDPLQGPANTAQEPVQQGSKDSNKQSATDSQLISNPSTVPTSTLSPQKPKSHNLLKPLLTAFPFDDFPDLVSEDDTSYSPITLSRNIFQWADANPSQNTLTTTIPPASTDITSHLNFSVLTGMDQYHINPLATLTLPSTSYSSANTMTAYPTTSSTTSANTVSSTTATSMAPTYTHSLKGSQSQSSLLLTPNLPTIIFPNVPASSARSGVHNLPPPTDLLSGLDIESRVDGQHAGFLWDEPIGNSSGNGLVLALGGNGKGSGERGSLEGSNEVMGMGLSSLGERSLLNSSI